jgi:hypothetical protein
MGSDGIMLTAALPPILILLKITEFQQNLFNHAFHQKLFPIIYPLLQECTLKTMG